MTKLPKLSLRQFFVTLDRNNFTLYIYSVKLNGVKHGQTDKNKTDS